MCLGVNLLLFSVALICRGVFGGSSFDNIVVISVSHRCVIIKNISVSNFSQKNGVGGSFHFINDLACDIAACLRNYRHHAFYQRIIVCKFIAVASAFKTKVSYNKRVAVFA